MTLTPLPGRIAVLVPDLQRSGAVLLPEAIRKRHDIMDAPGNTLRKGYVVAVGEQRGRVPMPQIGTTVALKPHCGLDIESGDLDISLGSVVPKGYALKVIGANKDDWTDHVLGEIDEFPPLVALALADALNSEKVAA